MTASELRNLVRIWDLSVVEDTGIADSKYGRILNQLDYHANREWSVYLPALHPDYDNSYIARLANWIGNISDESDQKLLLEYALYISFISHNDFLSLYSTALNREIMPWITSLRNIRLDCPNFHDEVRLQIHDHTWYCPISDSMDINEFCKINHLSGISHKPTFLTLEKFGDIDKIKVYVREKKIKQIVLLEDIVGSGTQSKPAIKWAIDNIKIPILFVPLILCPEASGILDGLEAYSGGTFHYRPVIKIQKNELLGPNRPPNEGIIIADRIEAFVEKMARIHNLDQNSKFGYNNTGSSLVMFSNTPDNTLLLVHHESPDWVPLFPRVYRGEI